VTDLNYIYPILIQTVLQIIHSCNFTDLDTQMPCIVHQLYHLSTIICWPNYSEVHSLFQLEMESLTFARCFSSLRCISDRTWCEWFCGRCRGNAFSRSSGFRRGNAFSRSSGFRRGSGRTCYRNTILKAALHIWKSKYWSTELYNQ